MSDPRPELVAWTESLYPDSRLEPLPGDASTRRFYRLFGPPNDRIVMDYGEPFEGETDDVVLARLFARADLPVAEVLAVGPEAGALVLEDLGESTLEQTILAGGGSPWDTLDWLTRAVELAAAVAARGTPVLQASDRGHGPILGAKRFTYEMDFFLRHYVAGYRDRPKVARALLDHLHGLAQRIASHPRVMCHRDFHSRNLMVRSDRSLAMVDIQDARWGPDAYDLASILRDAYLEIDEPWVGPLIESYRSSHGAIDDPVEFKLRFDLVSVQRMIKALGTFGYQVHELGRTRYEDAIPRTVARVDRALAEIPELASLRHELRDAGVLEV